MSKYQSVTPTNMYLFTQSDSQLTSELLVCLVLFTRSFDHSFIMPWQILNKMRYTVPGSLNYCTGFLCLKYNS